MNNLKYFPHLPLILFILFVTVVNLYADESLIEKGISEYKSENYEEALVTLSKVKQQHADSSTASFYLGLTYKQTGNYKEAAKNLRDAVTLIPAVKDAYIELIDVLYNLNELKEAKSRIIKAESEGVKPADIAFLKGLVLSKEDRNKEAIDAFKKAKELDRSLIQSSDFQIALLYAKGKRFAEAMESLRAVIAVDPNSEIASFAKEYEVAIARNLETYRAWRLTAGLSYQYDDNVVLKPSSAISGVEITGDRDSGVIGTFRVDYAPILNSPWFFNGQFNLYSNTYFHTNSHNLLAPTVLLDPGLIFQKGAVSFPLSYGHVWLHEREYMGVISVKPTLNLIFGPGHIGQFSAGYSKRDLLQPPLDRDEDRDGNVYSFLAGYIHPFSGEKGVFNLRYEFSRDLTDGKNWDNKGNKINFGLLVPIKDKVSLSIAGEAFLQDYKYTHTIFGLKRKDRAYTGSANIIWSILKKININLQYLHTTADSNIFLYEYKRNVYTAGIEYSF